MRFNGRLVLGVAPFVLVGLLAVPGMVSAAPGGPPSEVAAHGDPRSAPHVRGGPNGQTFAGSLNRHPEVDAEAKIEGAEEEEGESESVGVDGGEFGLPAYNNGSGDAGGCRAEHGFWAATAGNSQANYKYMGVKANVSNGLTQRFSRTSCFNASARTIGIVVYNPGFTYSTFVEVGIRNYSPTDQRIFFYTCCGVASNYTDFRSLAFGTNPKLRLGYWGLTWGTITPTYRDCSKNCGTAQRECGGALHSGPARTDYWYTFTADMSPAGDGSDWQSLTGALGYPTYLWDASSTVQDNNCTPTQYRYGIPNQVGLPELESSAYDYTSIEDIHDTIKVTEGPSWVDAPTISCAGNDLISGTSVSGGAKEHRAADFHKMWIDYLTTTPVC